MDYSIISLIGLLVAIFIIVYGSMKSISMVLLATVAALVVALTGGIGIIEGYGTVYIGGVGDQIKMLFPIFLSGQLFGKLIEVSGLPVSVANGVVKRFGTKYTVAAIFFATFLMCLGGISIFVVPFTIYPIAAELMKKARIPRELLPAIILAGANSQAVLPGQPTLNGLIIPEFFGVPYMAGPVLGIVAAIVQTVLCLWYFGRVVKKYQTAGMEFTSRPSDAGKDAQSSEENPPNGWLLLIPMGIVFVLLNVVKLPGWASLFIGTIVTAAMFFKRFKGKLLKYLEEGVTRSMSVISFASLTGFAALVTTVPGFASIQTFLTGLTFLNPYVLTLIIAAILCAVVGSGMGSQIAMRIFGNQLMTMGGDPAIISRILIQAGQTLDSMPHNTAVLVALGCCEVKHAKGYKHIFMTSAVISSIAAILQVLLAMMGVA